MTKTQTTTEAARAQLAAAETKRNQAKAAHAAEVARIEAARREAAALGEQVKQADPDAKPGFKELVAALTVADARVVALGNRVQRAVEAVEAAEGAVRQAQQEHASVRLGEVESQLPAGAAALVALAATFKLKCQELHSQHLAKFAEGQQLARAAGVEAPAGTRWAPQPAMPSGGWWQFVGEMFEASQAVARSREDQLARESSPAHQRHIAALIARAAPAASDRGGDGAKYLVTQEPGMPLPGVGFIRVGEYFTAPEGFTPPRSHWPLNQAAAEVLERVHGVKREVPPPAPPAPPVERALDLAERGAITSSFVQTAIAAAQERTSDDDRAL